MTDCMSDRHTHLLHNAEGTCQRSLGPLIITAFVTSGDMSNVPKKMDKMRAVSSGSGRNWTIQKVLSVSRRFFQHDRCYRLSVFFFTLAVEMLLLCFISTTRDKGSFPAIRLNVMSPSSGKQVGSCECFCNC